MRIFHHSDNGMCQHVIILVTFGFFISCARSYTYHIDSTCDKEPTLLPAIEEIIEMADYAHARLRTVLGRRITPTNPQDQNEVRLFGLLFDSDLHDTVISNKILGITEGLRGLKRAEDRTKSTIRIYCDNDQGERYQAVPDADDDHLQKPGPPKNSERTDDKEFDDVENGFRWIGLTRPCQYPLDKRPTSHTKSGNELKRGTYKHMRIPRAVVTFCTGSLVRGRATVKAQADLDLNRMLIKNFDTVTTMLVLHELLHAPPAWTVDVMVPWRDSPVPGVFKLAYAWMPVSLVALSRTEAFQNDDSFSYYILLAWLAKKGYTLSRAANEAMLGVIVRDDTIIPGLPYPVPPPLDPPRYAREPPGPPPPALPFNPPAGNLPPPPGNPPAGNLPPPPGNPPPNRPLPPPPPPRPGKKSKRSQKVYT